MSRNQQPVSASGIILLVFVLLSAVIAKKAYVADQSWYWYLCITIPVVILIAFSIRRKRIKV